MKIYMVSLLHRATIKKSQFSASSWPSTTYVDQVDGMRPAALFSKVAANDITEQPGYESDVSIALVEFYKVRARLVPLVWNSLPDYLRDPAVSRDTFCKHLKTFLFAVYTDIRSAHQRFYGDALYKSTFYLLTYFSCRDRSQGMQCSLSK